MSFNLRYGTADDGPNRWIERSGDLIALLVEQDYDLIGVQEALEFQIDEILSGLGNFEYVGVGREDGQRSGEFAAILFRQSRLEKVDSGTFWLSDHSALPGSNTWGDSNVRICTWAKFRDLVTGIDFFLFNTHLAVRSQVARAKGVELILAKIAEISGRAPVLITGDFNADEDNSCLIPLKRDGFLDTYREIFPDGPAPTFNGFGQGDFKEKIDYIWANRRVTTESAGIILQKRVGGWLSDHFPICARISF